MSTFIDGNLDRNRALYLLTMQDECIRGMADSWPEPRWVKFRPDGDHVFVMVWLNRAYVERFGVDGHKYIGHCDRVAWPDEVAARFARNDERAIERAGEVIEDVEPLPELPEGVRVRKLAFRINNTNLQGWAVYGECVGT